MHLKRLRKLPGASIRFFFEKKRTRTRLPTRDLRLVFPPTKMKTHRISADAKLQVLKTGDFRRKWTSLDEACMCVLCERSFPVRRIRGSRDRLGRITLRCPTPGCIGSPDEFVRQGNPLLSEDVWKDWQRVMNEAHEPRWRTRALTPQSRKPAMRMPD
jgi:hypothetical protein